MWDLTFKLYYRLIYSNTKTNSTLLKLVNKNLLCRRRLRRRQHMRVLRPLIIIYIYYTVFFNCHKSFSILFVCFLFHKLYFYRIFNHLNKLIDFVFL